MVVGKFLKNTLLLVFVLNNLIIFSQNFKVYKYTELSSHEYSEFTKNGITNKMDGNFSIITRSKQGDIIAVEIKRFKKGKKTGEWITYRSLFGILKLSFVSNYKNNELSGYYFRTDNHTFLEEGFYKANIKHGKWKYQKEDTETEVIYKNGKKFGSYKETFDTGSITGQFKNDKKTGVWLLKDDITGETEKEIYKDNKLIKVLKN
jgi:antitoxin component YwqK of YwqJK toxin-antitoxin module